MKPIPIPYLVRRVDDGRQIEIQWDQEGHAALFPAHDLRLMCQCAACVEEMSGRPTLDPASVPESVRALTMRLVGAYAIHFDWSDGRSEERRVGKECRL